MVIPPIERDLLARRTHADRGKAVFLISHFLVTSGKRFADRQPCRTRNGADSHVGYLRLEVSNKRCDESHNLVYFVHEFEKPFGGLGSGMGMTNSGG